MSTDANHLSKTDSRASSTGTRSSILSRASGFMMGSRRNQAASESHAATSSPSSTSSTSSTTVQAPTSFTAPANQTNSASADANRVRKFENIFTAPDPSVKLTPPAPLSHAQQAKYDEMLEYFKSLDEYPITLKVNSPKKPLTEWEKLRNLSRESMLRYLRATRWDVASAKKRLTQTIAWRREYGVDSLKAQDLEPEAMTGKETILGYDNRGRPLHYMHPSRNTTQETPRQMQFAVWILERAIDLMPPGVEMLALLINFAGKKRNPTSISNAKLMLYILQNHYVERLGIALCINVPWIFKAFWNAIYPFIDPVTKGKCKFDQAIKDQVPASQLATDFGGLLDFPYHHDKYWPQLVELTNKRREEQLERFRTLCNSQIGASEWVIRGGDIRGGDIRGGDDINRSTASHKQDSGFHQVSALSSAGTAKEVTDANAAGSHLEREGSSRTDSTAVEQATPIYASADAEADDDLDRFYTSQTELPPTLETEQGAASDWQHSTVVKEDSTCSTKSSNKSSNKHAHKHGDASLFAAVVGGISAGLTGGKAATGAAQQTQKTAENESKWHDKHNHINHNKAIAHRKSESETRPVPPISAV
ncbi:related to PDR16 - involved in lipid biosynthesis and multidrug resistance [Ustilago sp. UG-2017a]|nr:related to PDR16 - involved in lipid biosynthesis and multidrug resistance [Ustilago sp. UG-2017a]